MAADQIMSERGRAVYLTTAMHREPPQGCILYTFLLPTAPLLRRWGGLKGAVQSLRTDTPQAAAALGRVKEGVDRDLDRIGTTEARLNDNTGDRLGGCRPA